MLLEWLDLKQNTQVFRWIGRGMRILFVSLSIYLIAGVHLIRFRSCRDVTLLLWNIRLYSS